MIRSSCRAGNMPGLCVVPWEARQLSPGGPGARLWLCPAHPREPDGGHDDTVAEHSGELARLTRMRGRDGQHGVAAMRLRHQLDPRGWENSREVLARVVLDVGQAAGGGLRPVSSEEP